MTTNIEAIPGLQQLWAETSGDSDICLAILDGPVDRTYPGLRHANLNEVDTVTAESPDQGPATKHGTHVASVVFGRHDGPVKGIAPECRGLIVPIFEDGADGSIAPCSQLDLARAINQAVEAGANVINISGGELTPSGDAHPILADAVQACADRNVLIVAAAGNEGCECLHVPGALPSVLAVGAMNDQETPLDFSNWGERYSMQGILAPGENILGARPGGGTVTQSGTSYATPIISGIAGLLLSLQLKMGRNHDPQAVRAAILESAYACDPKAISDCRSFLVGSLNIPGAQRLITKEQGGDSFPQMSTGSELKALPSDNQPSLSEKETMFKKGDVAPDFSVKDHSDREVRLSDYKGKYVVLWFYPQADTPG